VVLDQAAVGLLGLGEVAQLEEREPEQVARALVARLVAQRLLQRVAGLVGMALRQRLGAGGERAIELLVLGKVGVVLVEDAGLCGARARFDAGAPRSTPASSPTAP
jgi:hypothetical protein